MTIVVADRPLLRGRSGQGSCFAPATVAALVFAAAYALSPLTVVFLLLLGWIVRCAVRGLDGRERTLVGGLLTLAIALRVLAIAGVFLTTNPWREPFHALFGDALFTIERSIWVRNLTLGTEIGPWYRLAVFDPYGGNVFYYYLAYLQVLFGQAPYAITLLSVAAFAGGAVLLHRHARAAFGAVPAGIGLAILLFWPTFFVWSISMLKESVLLFLSAAAIVCVARLAVAADWRPRLGAAAAAALALALLGTLRDGAIVVAAGAILFGVAVRIATLRSSVLAAAIVALVMIAVVASRTAVVRASIAAEVQAAVDRHIGHWGTPGVHFQTADDRFYLGRMTAIKTMTAAEGARFLARSAVAFVVVPLPWHIETTSGLLFLPEQFAWLTIVALGVIGTWVGLRRNVLSTALLAGFCLVSLAVIAPNSGNVGTLIRHRDAIVPFLVWLSGVGFESILVLTAPKHTT
jgi:hypothetical protein